MTAPEPTSEKTVEICGHKVTVTLNDNLLSDRGHYGEWCYRDLSIAINGTSVPTVRQQSLIHEFFEAVNEIYELDLDHYKIKTLAASTYQFIQKNQDLAGKV